jgi:hypothetical protein
METAVVEAIPAKTPTKFVIAVESYEKRRGGPKVQVWLFVTGFSYRQEDRGLKVKGFSSSMDRSKAKQFGRLDAEEYSEQLNGRSFGRITHVEAV